MENNKKQQLINNKTRKKNKHFKLNSHQFIIKRMKTKKLKITRQFLTTPKVKHTLTQCIS